MIKKMIIMLLIGLSFSCYLENKDDPDGNVTIKLYSDLMRAAPAGYDGELKVRFYNDGELDSILDYSSDIPPLVSYLSDLPTPVSIGGSSIITVPFIYGDSQLSVLNVPKDTALNVLIEYFDGDDLTDPYYLTYAGSSSSFQVGGGETAEVSVILQETAYATITGNASSAYTVSSVYIDCYDPEEIDLAFFFDSSYPDNINQSSNYGSYDPFTSGSATIDNPATPTLLTFDAILPGKKTRLVVKPNTYMSDSDYIGLSEEIELSPGSTLENINITYYSFASWLS